MIVPLLHRLFPRHWLRICLGLGVILLFVPGSDFLATKQFNEFFLFFVLGIAARKHYDIYLLGIEKYFLPATTVLVLGIALIITNYFPILLITLCPSRYCTSSPALSYVGTIGFIPSDRKKYLSYIFNEYNVLSTSSKSSTLSFSPCTEGLLSSMLQAASRWGTLGPVAAQRLVISNPYL
jgi:hypothetical protein